MQAVILAGGLATRLYPRTLSIPKALVPVAGRPFIEWQLERIAAHGYDRVVLCVGHLGEQIEAHVGDGRRSGLDVRYAYDGPALLGTAGALRRALPLLDEVFLVTYGDSYLPFDYAGPLRDLGAHPEASGTMSVYRNLGQWDASNVMVQGEQVVRYEKGVAAPELDHIDYGALALRRSVISSIEPDVPRDLSALLSALARDGALRAYLAHERFYEIGSEQGLRDLESRLSS